MQQEGSYHVQNIAGSVEGEIKRLQGQIELFWKNEFKHYLEFGLNDGLSVIELGAGPGFVTEKIAEQLPLCTITALEIDPFLVEYARNYLAQKGRERCTVIQGSIMATGQPDDTYDFALIRLVLEHLPDPSGAIREVLRILKPGGKAIFVDNDFEMHIMAYPHIPELRELYDAYCQARYHEGGNPKIGRELPGLLKKEGFSKVAFEVISAHSDLVGDELFLRSEGIGIPSKLVQDGYLTSKTLGKISVGWRDMIRSKDHAIIRQIYLAAGEKGL
jgi:ubiquinone/menaquinone biosynthesis C-methylase UbiE